MPSKRFPVLIPEFYSKLIDWNNPRDPLRKMVEPSSLENSIKKYEKDDPIGDKPKTVVRGLIHRYPDRVLLNLTMACAVHCRFCFRKNLLVGKSAQYKPDIGKIISYLKNHKEIWEVIFSGGDPFMIPAKFLDEILLKINKLDHVHVVRFHTRIPVVDPLSLNKNGVIGLLDRIFNKARPQAKKLIIVIHVNHPKEITEEFRKTICKFEKLGAMVLSQTVLLKGVNDSAKILAELFRKLVASGVKPYYLHHLDIAKGTHYFRVSIEKGKKIFQNLRENLSGICLPEYVVEIPGGMGKIPVFRLNKIGKKNYTATNLEGKKVKYVDFA